MRSVPCVWSWRSLDHLPFDDGWLVCPLAFRYKKGEYFGVLYRVFVFRGSLFVFGFLFSGGVYLFLVGACGVLCLKLTLYLCIFSSYLAFDGIFLLGGVLCLIGTLFVSCFKLLIDLYL